MPIERFLTPEDDALLAEAHLLLKIFSDTATITISHYKNDTKPFVLYNGLHGLKLYRRRYATAAEILRATKRFCTKQGDMGHPPKEGMTNEEEARLAALNERRLEVAKVIDWPGNFSFKGPRAPSPSGQPRRPFQMYNIMDRSGGQSSEYATRSFSTIDRLETFFEKYVKVAMTIEDRLLFRKLESMLFVQNEGADTYTKVGTIRWIHEDLTKPIDHFRLWRSRGPEQAWSVHRTLGELDETVLSYMAKIR